MMAQFLAQEKANMEALGEAPLDGQPLEGDATLEDSIPDAANIPLPSTHSSSTSSLASSASLASPASLSGSLKGLSLGGAIPSPSATLTSPPVQEESDHVREWRAQREERLAARAIEENQRHKDILAKAQQDIQTFYEGYAKEKLAKQMGSAESQAKAASQTPPVGPVSWADVYARIEGLSKPKGAKDTSRLKGILAAAAKVPPAASAV